MRSILIQVSIFCLIFACVLSLSTSKLHKQAHKDHSVHKKHDKLKPVHRNTHVKQALNTDFDFEMETQQNSGIVEAITLIKTAESEIGELSSKMAHLSQELESAKADLEKSQLKSQDKSTPMESKKDETVDAEESQKDETESRKSEEPELKAEELPEIKAEEQPEAKVEELPEAKSEEPEVKAEEPVLNNTEEPQIAKEDDESNPKADDGNNSSNESGNEQKDDNVEQKNESTNVSAEADAESNNEISLLQISMPVADEMNSVDDDDSSAPVLMAMKRHTAILAQKGAGSKIDDSGFTFGAMTDGSGKTFDITKDGKVVYPPPGAEQDELLKAVARAGVDAKDRNEKPINATEATDDSNVVCVCKRHGAPRGFDRIRCKRNPTPTPTPTVPPQVPVGIKQCANGSWAVGSEKGTSDVICIYFPAEGIKVTPPPVKEPEPEYPAECYDDRNEYVAEGVQQRARDKIDIQLLIQDGYQSCGC